MRVHPRALGGAIFLLRERCAGARAGARASFVFVEVASLAGFHGEWDALSAERTKNSISLEYGERKSEIIDRLSSSFFGMICCETAVTQTSTLDCSAW